MPSISIIIVNWNSWDVLAICLYKLKMQTYSDFNVLIIDNASATIMPEKFLSCYDNVKLLRNKINVGFAAANNQAINSLPSDSWCVLLNPDAFPEPDWLEKLVNASIANKQYVFFASRQLMYNNPDLLDGDGDAYHASGLIWRHGHGQSVQRVAQINHEVFSACAAAAMYKTSALLEAGGFDEDYFCYAEDVDLGFRLRLAGYKCLLVTDAIVHHVGSASTGGQRSDFSVYHGHRNLVWTYVKNMPGGLFWFFLPLHLLMNIVSLVLFGLRGQGAVIFRAKIDALKQLPLFWRKRKTIQMQRIATIKEIWQQLDKSFFK
jgi:GT2 family glycosyltransferase